MKFVAFTTLTAAALTVGACGHKEPEVASTNVTTTTVSETDAATPAISAGQTFANAAAASDSFEIATSKLALAKSSSASIKKFAESMITAHTDSTAKLKAAAASASPAIAPDPMLTAEQQAKLDSLQTLSGMAFDQAYAAAQVDGHQKTLDALKAYSATGEVPSLKAFASKLTPTVAAHLNMAKGL